MKKTKFFYTLGEIRAWLFAFLVLSIIPGVGGYFYSQLIPSNPSLWAIVLSSAVLFFVFLFFYCGVEVYETTKEYLSEFLYILWIACSLSLGAILTLLISPYPREGTQYFIMCLPAIVLVVEYIVFFWVGKEIKKAKEIMLK